MVFGKLVILRLTKMGTVSFFLQLSKSESFRLIMIEWLLFLENRKIREWVFTKKHSIYLMYS